jgi:methionyl aminopeptidase
MIAKSEMEIEALREGGKRLARILANLKDMVAPGVNTQTLEDEARRLIKEAGGTPAFLGYTPKGSERPYPSALCVSINEVIVHGIPNENEKEIFKGDIVTLDCGFVYEGLITDSAVTVIAGKGSQRVKELVNAVYEALEMAIKVAVPGNTTGDIGHEVEKIAKKYGLNAPLELGGHGVGKGVHEDPFIPNWGSPGKGDVLKEGMVLAIEPMFSLGNAEVILADDGYTYYTKDGSKTAHAEHTVLITKDEAEILTKI